MLSKHDKRKCPDANPVDGRDGFTLLELMLVMTLLAIISVAVVPIFSGSVGMVQMRSTRANFVGLLSHVQERAVAESREYRLYIDDRENSYWVARRVGMEDGEKIFEAVEEPFGQLHYLPRNVRVLRLNARKDPAVDAYYVACHPNGASDDAEISFQDETDPSRYFTVFTKGHMGKISVMVWE